MTRRTVFKPAITGRFVSEAYADRHPASTYEQTIMPWRWIKRVQARRFYHNDSDVS